MARAVIDVRLLAAFAVSVDGTQAGPWGRPYAKRLVQLLTLRSGHLIGREELAATLFPDLRPDRAANSVSKALTLARRALERTGQPVLAADRNSIWIADGIEVQTDLERAHDLLRAALALP